LDAVEVTVVCVAAKLDGRRVPETNERVASANEVAEAQQKRTVDEGSVGSDDRCTGDELRMQQALAPMENDAVLPGAQGGVGREVERLVGDRVDAVEPECGGVADHRVGRENQSRCFDTELRGEFNV
jgi:hypothetical protein